MIKRFFHFFFLSTCFCAVFLLFSSAPTWARKQKPEIYSATEVSADFQDEGSLLAQNEEKEETNPRQTPSKKNKVQPSRLPPPPRMTVGKKVKELEKQLAKIQKNISRCQDGASKPGAPTSSPSIAFDVVPAEQKDSILNRIRLAERLVRQHGRAYDYRTHTTEELEKIFSSLEASPLPTPPPPSPETQDNPPVPLSPTPDPEQAI